MSDLITRKPTPAMIELLRRGAASTKGIMTLFDPNCRTLDGLYRRDMAETVSEPGTTSSWVVISNRGRAFLVKLDAAEERKAAQEARQHEEAHNAHFLNADGTFRADRSSQAYMSAVDNADQTAREEGFERGTDPWYKVITSSYASLLDDGEFAEPAPAAEEQQEAPQEAASAPVAAPQRPALADIAKVTEGPVTLGQGADAVTYPGLLVIAYGKTHEFADIDGTWVEVCGRCGGEGRLSMYAGIHGGVCYGCNRAGLRPDIFTGTREQRDAFVYAWAVKRNRERRRDEKAAALVHAKRVAERSTWEAANGELLAWARALTPDATERVLHDYCVIEDTRDEAVRCAPHEEVIDGPMLLTGDGPEAGRWWARLGSYEVWEDFRSHGGKVALMIKEVRSEYGTLDRRETAFLAAVMRRVVTAEATTRFAGPVDAEVTVTGRVKKVLTVDGYNQWAPSRRMVVLEGTGEDAGITVVAYSASAAAKSLQEGQEGVTVTGVVSKHKERSGERETAVARPKIKTA